MPFGVFLLLTEATLNVAAGEQLRMMQAVAHGIGVAVRGDTGEVGAETSRLERAALPRVQDAGS